VEIGATPNITKFFAFVTCKALCTMSANPDSFFNAHREYFFSTNFGICIFIKKKKNPFAVNRKKTLKLAKFQTFYFSLLQKRLK